MLPTDFHFAPLPIDHKTVGQQRIIRRTAIEHRAGQQRRVEPTAVLIRAFEVQIRRPFQAGCVRAAQHMKMRRPSQTIHPACLCFSHNRPRRCPKFVDVQRLPRFNAVRPNQLRHALQQFRRVRVQLPRHFMQENGIGAPLALARQRPVRTVWQSCCANALSPRWKNCVASTARKAVSRKLSPFTGFIHRGEPLRRRTVDQRRFVAPAVHVAVRVLHHFQQCTDLFSFSTMTDWLSKYARHRRTADRRRTRRSPIPASKYRHYSRHAKCREIKSSTPYAGAECTIPVPASVVT